MSPAVKEQLRYEQMVGQIRRAAPPARMMAEGAAPSWGQPLWLGADPNQIAQLMMMEAWQRLREEHEPSRSVGSAKALKKLHAMEERVFLHPKEVISEYLSDIMRAMNVQAWAIADFSEKVKWGKMTGLGRVLGLALKGQSEECAAYLVPILRSAQQASIDGGGWQTAMHLLPRDDPWERVLFGGSQGDLETIAGYQEALRKLRKGAGRGEDGAHDDAKGGSKGAGRRSGKKNETSGGDGN